MVENIGLEIRIVSNLIYNKMNQQAMAAENISAHQCLILQHLENQADAPVYQKDIERMFSVRRSTANQMLRTLEERELIQRLQSPDDARKNILVITPKGKEACAKLNGQMRVLLESLIGGIPREELEQFQTTLRKLWHNMESCGLP